MRYMTIYFFFGLCPPLVTFLVCLGTFFIYSPVVTPLFKIFSCFIIEFLAVICFLRRVFNLSYLIMSDIAFVNVIGSLYVYFRFNSCLISAYALVIILLYFLNLIYFEERLGRRLTRSSSIYMICLPLGWSHSIFNNYYQYYVRKLVILMQLPEDPEPSSSLGASILRIIRLRLLASLTGYAIIQFFHYHNAQLKEFLKLFLLHEIGLCLAGLLMASENTAKQSYFCVSF